MRRSLQRPCQRASPTRPLLRTVVRLAALSLLPLGLLQGCGERVASRELPAEPPVTRITLVDTATDGRRISLYLEAAVDWKSLVDLETFDGFEPAMSHDRARSSVGPPDEIRGSEYVYDRPWGEVIVERVRDRSGGDVFEQWQTRSHPSSSDLASIISPDLLRQIDAHGRDRSVITLFEPSEYGPLLRVRIREGRVDSITWYHD